MVGFFPNAIPALDSYSLSSTISTVSSRIGYDLHNGLCVKDTQSGLEYLSIIIPLWSPIRRHRSVVVCEHGVAADLFHGMLASGVNTPLDVVVVCEVFALEVHVGACAGTLVFVYQANDMTYQSGQLSIASYGDESLGWMTTNPMHARQEKRDWSPSSFPRR